MEGFSQPRSKTRVDENDWLRTIPSIFLILFYLTVFTIGLRTGC